MNNMEEKLWEYIDGTCSAEERRATAALIEKDKTWCKAYNDLLEMNAEISVITLDEPPMSFSFKVMEGIRTQEALKPLKTNINTIVVKGIAGFFILTLVLLVVLIFRGSNQSLDINLIQDVPYLSFISEAVKVFFYFDVMLLLFLVDQFLRRKRSNDVAKSV